MTRWRIAALDNHKITDGTVTGVDRALLQRVGDVREELPDGQTFGSGIEDTVFVFDPVSGTTRGEPGTPRDEWRHPVTNEPMTVNPKFYIIETIPIPPNDPATAEFTDPEVGPPPAEALIQSRKYEVVRSGTPPNTLTPAELTILTDTYRLNLNRGRTLQVFQLRPAPS